MLAQHQGGLEKEAMLFLASYVFMLRLPSEALPLRARTGSMHLTWEGGQVLAVLQRRKNKPAGSRLVRQCWCKSSPMTCPLHVLWKWAEKAPAGALLFAGVTEHSALVTLRMLLRSLAVPRACEYRTHDFRRGHAKDLQLSGKNT